MIHRNKILKKEKKWRSCKVFFFFSRTMSIIPLIETDQTSSTITDDEISIVVNESSRTTITTETSTSWHSVESDIQINHNLALRSQSINPWLKVCFIEPDIRLTTAQEWKLRTCIRRLLSFCHLPLKISCVKREEPELDRLEQLGLYLQILSLANANPNLLDVKLVEFYSEQTLIAIPLIKLPKFLFHISSNLLHLSLRCANSLLELRFSTREQEPIHGNYYQWNELFNEHRRYDVIVQIDHSLISQLNTV